MKHITPSYRKTAYLLAALFTLIAAGSLIWILLVKKEAKDHTASLTACIYQKGVLLQSIPLYDVKEPYTFTVTGENGCQNTVEVRPGSIGVRSADCPDQLCVLQGFIDQPLLPITCLPNHLVIQLQTADGSSDSNTAPDAVSY